MERRFLDCSLPWDRFSILLLVLPLPLRLPFPLSLFFSFFFSLSFPTRIRSTCFSNQNKFPSFVDAACVCVRECVWVCECGSCGSFSLSTLWGPFSIPPSLRSLLCFLLNNLSLQSIESEWESRKKKTMRTKRGKGLSFLFSLFLLSLLLLARAKGKERENPSSRVPLAPDCLLLLVFKIRCSELPSHSFS